MTDLIKRLDLLLRQTGRGDDRLAISHTQAIAVRDAIWKIEALTAEVADLKAISAQRGLVEAALWFEDARDRHTTDTMACAYYNGMAQFLRQLAGQ